MFSRKRATLSIGKLGDFAIVPGYYLYVGSALGAGGLRARISRHLRLVSRPHWHIDYLKPHLAMDSIWYAYDRVRRECQWGQQIQQQLSAQCPIPGFGASDCRCQTHLYALSAPPSFDTFSRGIKREIQGHPDLFCWRPGRDPAGGSSCKEGAPLDAMAGPCSMGVTV